MGSRRRFRLLTLVVLLAAASCNGAEDEAADTTAPTETDAVATTTPPPSPPGPAPGALSVGELRWESLNGPPGGRAAFVAQDPYRPEHVYAISGPGVYQTSDQGASWVRFAPAAAIDVSAVAFGPNGVYVCGMHGLVLIEPSGIETPLSRPCFTIAADDEWVYASNWSEALQEPRVELWRASTTAGLPTQEGDWTEITPPHGEMTARVGPDAPDLSIDELITAGDSLLATIALGHGAGPVNALASRLFVSRDHGDSWLPVDVGIPEPLALQKLRHDSGSGLTFALAHINITDGPGFPVTDLVRVSDDDGLTWRPLTTGYDFMSNTVGDVEVLEDRYLLSNVGFGLTELDRDNPNEVLSSAVRPIVSGFPTGYTIEELVFDSANPGVVYAKPYLDHDGVARSVDGGLTWEASVNGIVAAPVGNINVSPTDPDVMVASGNLGYPAHMTRDGGATWHRVAPTENMADEVSFNPHDPDHMLFMSEITNLLDSADGGVTWNRPAAEFTGTRVHSLSLSPDEDVLFASNLGINLGAITGVRPGGEPMGLGESFWFNLLRSPDYAYSIATAPDGTLFASYSPKKFEDYAAVWRYRGSPQGEPDAWEEALRIPGAAGITDVTVGPGDPYTIYAGVTGNDPGVWASRDGGDTWASLHTDGFNFVTVHAVAIDPHDPAVIFAAPWGDGLHRSVDGGRTWERLIAPTVSVAAIVVDPEEGNHVLIGDRTRPVVWESWDSGTTWSPLVEIDDALHYRVMALADTDEGIYVSLLNRSPEGLAIFAGAPESGSTYRIDGDGVHPIAGLSRAVLSFADQGDAVYAVTHLSGVYEIYRDAATEISATLPDMGFNHVLASEGTVIVSGGADVDAQFRSRIGDPTVVHNIYKWAADGTWQPLLSGDPFRSPIKQVARHAASGALVAATGTGVYVSIDEGSRWTSAGDDLDFVNIGAMALVEDTVVVGTLGAGVAVGTLRIAGTEAMIDWRSQQGPSPAIANIRIEADAANPDRLWASSYPGGVFRSSDGGATWLESNFGIPSFEVADPVLQGYYSLAVDPARPERLYLSIFEHGVFVSNDGAATWRPLGLYGANQELMKSELTYLAIDGDGGLWLATSDRGVLMSADGGSTWQGRNEGLGTTEILTLEIASSGAVFAGTAGYGVYMLEPGASQWQHLGDTIGIGEWDAWDRRLYQYGSFLFDPEDDQRVYLGHFPGGFFVSDDRGGSWRTSNNGMGNDGIFSLTVHPDDPNILFAGTYNGILRSDNRGENWRDTSDGMPPEQWPFSVVIDPEDPDLMYTATKNGQNKGFCARNLETFCGTVMRSNDGGISWSEIGPDLPKQAEYYMLAIDPRDRRVLYLSSSRGVWVSSNQGDSWKLMNAGLPDMPEFFIRDNVAHNMEITPDGKALVLAVVGYGVYRAALPALTGS